MPLHKLPPIFRADREQSESLSEAARYALELYRANFKMQIAVREAAKLYGVDSHKISSRLISLKFPYTGPYKKVYKNSEKTIRK
jgi:hypothetical protein